MSTLIDFAEAIGTYIISVFNFIVFLLEQLVNSVLIMIDLIPRLYVCLRWMPVVCLGIIGAVFAILIVERILKLVGLFI